MKRTAAILGYGLMPILGLLWAIGCSTSTSHLPDGGGGNSQWSVNVTVQPNPIHPDTGHGIVYCQLAYGDTVMAGYAIHFRATSQSSSSSNITSTSWTSDTDSTGMAPTVFYNPNNYAGDYDTIYAVFLSANQIDTTAWDSTVVQIIQPPPADTTLDVFVIPSQIQDSTGQGTISCLLRMSNVLVPGYTIRLRATSGALSTITSEVISSDTSATGTVPTAYYSPTLVTAEFDTIIGAALTAIQDTMAVDSFVVDILH